jgi:hypothetical protein
MPASDNYLAQVLGILQAEGFWEDRVLTISAESGDSTVVVQDIRYRINDAEGCNVYPAVHIWFKPRVATPEVRLGWYNLDRNIPMVLGNNITRIRLNRKILTDSLRVSFKDQLEGLRLDLGTLDEQYEALSYLVEIDALDHLQDLSGIAARLKHPLRREDHLVDAWHMVNETVQ